MSPSLPAMPESWQGTLDTLRPPRAKDEAPWEWRKKPLLPVSFEPPSRINSGVAHLHLGFTPFLLVEDEDQVRTVASSILTALGYRVVTTSGPCEALRASELHGGRIDLLLTDIVMPEMNGRQLAKRIALFRPNIATVFMSGYTDNAIQHQGVLDASDAFLQKPFNPSSLARKVREVLDRAPES